MTNGSKIVEAAAKEVGEKELPANTNKTKYGKWFGWDGVAWCAIFVSWCYDQAGFPLKGLGFARGMAGCQTGVSTFRKRQELTLAPVEGDIVFFDWNGDSRYDHVGIFVKWIEEGETFETIEGNTSFTNQSNGGMVMRRKRNFHPTKTIFAHPKILDKK